MIEQKYTMNLAEKLNISILEPITIDSLLNKGYSLREEKFLIDDYDYVSKYAIQRLLGIKIDLAFMTAKNTQCGIQLNE